jgi:ribosomal-protein-alanine N-acetyltransferase
VRVRLERPSARDDARFLEAARRSRAHLQRWAPLPATTVAYRAYLRRLRRASQEGRFVVLRATGDLVGVINVSEIVRGNLRSAYLGYYAFVPHARRRYMTEGLALALGWAFGPLGLSASRRTSSRGTGRRGPSCVASGSATRDSRPGT